MPANSTSITKISMGMPVTVMIAARRTPRKVFDDVFDWFEAVDARYSPYKPDSEVSGVNNGLPIADASQEMKMILALCEETKKLTHGYFDVYFKGTFDPSGLVKGWAIKIAAEKLYARGYRNFYVEAGGDIQTFGMNPGNLPWQIGIRNPFKPDETIKVLSLSHGEGVATSGAYLRGDHIYNPKVPAQTPSYYASVTVVAQNIYEADRFATAAYAMGKSGAAFIEALNGIEAYLVDQDGIATMTSGLAPYVLS